MPKQRGTCTVDGCERPHLARGMCHGHYYTSRIKVDDYTDAVCPTCRAEYRRNRKATGPGCRSCNTRAGMVESYRRGQRKPREKVPRWPSCSVRVINCKRCAVLFTVHTGRKYCNDECAREAAMEAGGFRNRLCRDCGESPVGLYVTYCEACRSRRYLASRKAHRAKRRALKRDPNADRIDPTAVFERDNWKCGICHRKVNPVLTHPHPRSASLDHIVPLSPLWGGTHTLSNVQLAHLSCNMKKSDRIASVQPMLLAG